MHKLKSIFVKIGLVMAPIVLLLDLLVLALTYNITYENNLEICENRIRNAAQMMVEYCESYNLYENMEPKGYSREYDEICKFFDITYIFVVEPDVETNSETYLAIGFGKDALQEAKDTRYPGVKVEGFLNESEIEAYNGNTDGVIRHESGWAGESLICYMPCMNYYRSSDQTMQKYDTPLIVGAELSLNRIVESFQQRFQGIAILTVSLTLLMVVVFGVILYWRVSRPIHRISSRMSGFISDRKKGIKKLEVKGNDEFAQMSRAFNTMTEEIDTYIRDIDALTREKHTHETELNIARRIQKGLLRPDCFHNDSVAIDAYMLPAKEVGGDLYDYQVLDDGRVFIAVADVSGKGISAALFMAHAVTLLHQIILTEPSPAEILSVYNNTLVTQNPGGMFITTFLAVWDPATGELTYSNAGHNIPYILADTLIALDGAHGVAAGLFEGEEYENATVMLREGDTLFLYTDGVNEAKNTESAFYSTERLEEKLTLCSKTNPCDALHIVLDDLTAFTRGAEQNDDITMLTLHIKKPVAETTLSLRSELSQLKVIKDAIAALDVSDEVKMSIQLAAEEMFVNICSYAYDAVGDVTLTIRPESEGVSLTFVDSGMPFDPTTDLPDIDEYDHDHAIGGLGRFLTFSVADRYQYEYRDHQNVLYLFFSEVTANDRFENA
ncbi:MAG: SpoIIE family protein phosphatase [Clostridia bacterium]|nr:SpoIIE family protein phosphatase [Clostridia bacterium]